MGSCVSYDPSGLTLALVEHVRARVTAGRRASPRVRAVTQIEVLRRGRLLDQAQGVRLPTQSGMDSCTTESGDHRTCRDLQVPHPDRPRGRRRRRDRRWPVSRPHRIPLGIGCFERNTAEPTTIVPIITAFRNRHDLADTPTVVAADADMFSSSNLKDLDAAGLGFIVGSRSVKAPTDLASHFHWGGDFFTDGQIIYAVTPRHVNTVVNNIADRAEPAWNPDDHPGARRAIWQ